MNTRKIKLSFLTFFIVFLVSSCFKEEVAPQFQEIRRVVSAEDIPNVTSALLNRMGLENSIGRFSVNNGQSEDIFDIDWDKILQLVDSVGQETYTFSIKDNDGNPFVFYNLVIRFNEFGDAFYPFLMRYEMSEEFIPVYLETGSMDRFSGKISKIIIGQPASSNQENSLNFDPQAPTSITPTSDCPQQDVDMDDGSSDGGASGGPSIGGPDNSGGSSGSTTYRVCEYYTQDVYWVSITEEGITNIVYDYTILREECYTIVVSHTETPESPECEIGDGDIPILNPSFFRELIDDTQLSVCHKAVLNKLLGQTDWISSTVFGLFKSSVKFDIDFITTTNNNRTEAGWTDYPFTFNQTTGRYKTKIYLNNRYGSTDLSIAKTLLHEVMHAYLMYEQKTNPNFSTNYGDLINTWTATNDLNQSQHEEIKNYVNQIAIALQSFDSNAQNGIDFYTGLAWGGLQTTSAYTNLSLADRTKYNKIISDELNNTISAKGTLCQ